MASHPRKRHSSSSLLLKPQILDQRIYSAAYQTVGYLPILEEIQVGIIPDLS
jgi:hypothetical protein